MAPLKSLEQEYPIIDSNFQHFCASHAIFSGFLLIKSKFGHSFWDRVEDLLIGDVYMLAVLAEQLPNSERLKQGITQLLSIIDSWHQPWMNGMELLEDAEQNKHTLTSGCERIDVFLQDGFREGHVIELVGPSSSGKTQVCLQAASGVAVKLGSVIFIDTGNSFSPKRIAEIVSQISGPADKEGNRILQRVMKNIVCHSVFDIYTLLDVIYQLKSHPGSNLRLLIIDSISSLIAPILGGSSAEGHAMMVSVGYLLKGLADKHNICVLVTNHMVGGEGGNSKPALGESWKSIPHVRLQLSRDHTSNMYTISVLRHPNMGYGKTLNFMIS